MIEIQISLFRHCDTADKLAIEKADLLKENTHNAFWSVSDLYQEVSEPVGNGKGLYGRDAMKPLPTNSHFLRFEIQTNPSEQSRDHGGELLLSSSFYWPTKHAIFRLDQVTFPPKAIAYRHIHAGAGIRHLTLGGLHIEDDKSKKQMHVGDSWFEAFKAPVRATAIEGATTQFIRAMLIPSEYEGKPTIQILDKTDRAKPSLQKNHRFFDQRIEF